MPTACPPRRSQAQLEFYRNRLIDGIEEKQRKVAEQSGFGPRRKAEDSKAPEKRRRVGLAGARLPRHTRLANTRACVRPSSPTCFDPARCGCHPARQSSTPPPTRSRPTS